ncbi:MAG: lamin tail domain-containing protein [Candidatus Sabulitectum sp.]|nr:lamin tail domain-containing protein [Candidatus Sabulitectum sp.]
MEALIFFTAMLCSQPVISEVCSNPFNETAGEFVEIHNDAIEALDVAGYSITDGDALDGLLPWTGAFPQAGVTTGTTIIPAGGFAVLLEEDYPDDPWLTFPDGTVILTTGDHAICNGLAASSDPLTLYRATGSSQSDAVSTFGTPAQFDDWHECDDDGLDSIPFDPGEGLSIGRYPLNSPDCEGAWFAGGPTPGQPPEAPPDTFFITIDSLFLDNPDPTPGSTIILTALISCWGTVSPDSGNIILFIDADGDSIPQPGEILYCIPAEYLNPGETDTLETIFSAPETGWYPAVCSAPEVTDRIHFSTGGGINPVITEVMANPLNEDQEEFIEVFYPGPGVFPLAGCSFTDGDAVDQIISINGKAYIKADQAAVILDPEYQGTLNIPPDTPIFTPGNTTIGNCLTTDDPILLYLQSEPSLASLLSTSGTPLLYDDPLMCDDDGLDNIPFNPGDGCSMERISPSGPDAEFNWMASQPGGTPGIVTENQGWTDLSTDSIYTDNTDTTIQAIFGNCGVFDAEGLCTIFFDLDCDLSPSSGETIHEQTINLSAGQSDTLSIPFSPPDSGLFVIAATIQNSADTLTANNTQHCSYIPAKPAWPVITEVLCNPTNEDCDEFIEMFFPGPGLADITEFSITDNDAIDKLTALTTQFLTPGSYALILDPEYEEGSMPYDIPDGTAIFHPTNTTIGDGLSGTDPALLLFDSLAVSTYGTPDNPGDDIPFDPGADLSVERITPNHPDLEENWISSPEGPTPGAPPNGITEGIDYCMVSAALSPPMGEETTHTQVEIRLTCAGTDTVSQGDLCIKITADGAEIHSSAPPPPAMGDTLTIKADWQGVAEQASVAAELFCTEDGNPSNNTAEVTWNPAPALCINEIFYHETEWIELFNGTESTVSLSNYTISDAASSSQLPSEQLAPEEFIILTSSADDFQYRWGSINCPVVELDHWPTLNNSGDSLTLAENSQPIDMVPYTSQWGGNAGASLERRSHTVMGFFKDNWGTSISSATPGAVNSIGEVSSNEFLSLTPTIFNPPNTPLRIEVNLPMQACNVTVKVFDVRGMELENLYSSIVPGELLVLEWFGNEYPIGRYIVFAEAVCAGEKLSDAQVVILARPL